ncbi:ketopantoate reductase PanE/ApbA family protein [Methyloversatilis sp. RAC08]|uniref:D-amino acid dehydrogenase n=1 Tax=Methyloversatilis sp. RAC08 TaxID=1842540 RepID=UPI00083E5CB1|nr:D-amino acid dehydrogenase [Methyloversatilis sp. RAC08]AOF81446.1 ketopantoate reductase PanE/ApbA family protein [Methyloversatilis sp. RAC08]
MHILVLGAGVVGITTAWYLRQAGHSVTVVDRQSQPAMETSFANGGQISVSHAAPWATPQAPGIGLRGMGRSTAPVRFSPTVNHRQWRWMAAFLLQCRPGRVRANTDALARLAIRSQVELGVLRRTLELDYAHAESGILHVFFNRKELARAQQRARILHKHGIRIEVCDAARCIDIEPALASSTRNLIGGLFAPNDESGDACAFTRQLAQRCVDAGVVFHYETTADSLDMHQGRVRGVAVRDARGVRGLLCADQIVCSLGTYTRALVEQHGPRPALYPIKGYSITFPAGPNAPRVSITDEEHRIVMSRLGDNIRVAGLAELGGHTVTVDDERVRLLTALTRTLCPDAGDIDAAQAWAGLRPCTPGNVPLIGRSRIPGLWYNTGHGSLGWTLACGSARLLADLVDGGSSDIEFPHLTGKRH